MSKESSRDDDVDPMLNEALDEEEDEEERISRNRERNKEHARKTRMRKKEQLSGLKARVSELEEEGKRLKQEIEAASVASILVGLSSGNMSDDTETLPSSVPSSPSNFGASLSGGKRKRFLSLDGEDSSPPPMELNIKGQITLVGGSGNDGKTQINWKTGVYCDEEGNRQQLTQTELEALRRERNRMHAKMTRDRKKCYVASIKRVISKLEEENQQLRETLVKSKSLAPSYDFSPDVSRPSQESIQSGATELKEENQQLHETLVKSTSSAPSFDFSHDFSRPSQESIQSGAIMSSKLPTKSNGNTPSVFSSSIYTFG